MRKIEDKCHKKIPETPQSLIDHAVYQLDYCHSRAMALESMWRCGSLVLENFAFTNGFDSKLYVSKNYLASFLDLNKGFHLLWGNLWK